MTLTKLTQSAGRLGRVAKLACIALSMAVCGAGGAAAETLTIGLSGFPVSIDPHFAIDTRSGSVNKHIFDTLFSMDKDLNLQPEIAESAKVLDELTWEFKIRKDVKFHDGTPLTAADVVASLERAKKDIHGGTSPLKRYTKSLVEITATSDYVVRIKTSKPMPLLRGELTVIPIIKKSFAATASSDAFNSGEAVIGSGPYKFVEFVPNERLVLTPNEDYRGGVEPWTKVTFKMIKNPAARVAALLAGDVDLIDSVSPPDMPRLDADKSVTLYRRPSTRLIYLIVDGRRDVTPFAWSKDGKEIPNPFKDLRIRQAISLSIDRQAIVAKVLGGAGVATGQPLVEGMAAYLPDIKVPHADLKRAKALLADAGYPKGFKLKLFGPDGRYLNDAQVTQAVGQMLTRLGLEVEIETPPYSIWHGRGNKLEYSISVWGSGVSGGGGLSTLKHVLHSRTEGLSFGASNRGAYSNAKLDALSEKALTTFDNGERVKLMQEGMRIATEDLGIIPLYHLVSVWGAKAGLTYVARTDQETLAMGVRKK